MLDGESIKILLTGPPGCGKTTVVRRVLDLIPNLPIAGFFTEEIRVEGRRVGFDMIGLGGGRYRLSHVDSPSEIRVGRYGVELDGLETLIEKELTEYANNAELIVIDEIAKKECFSERFIRRVREILGSRIPLLATVAIAGRGLIQEVKDRVDIELIHVTDKKRDALPKIVAEKYQSIG